MKEGSAGCAVKIPARRQVLKGLGALCSVPLLPSIAFATSRTISYEEFLQLSKLLTGSSDVEHHTAATMFETFRKEPWGMEHMYRVYSKIRDVSELQLSKMDDGERWFTGHLLNTWITGIYYHESGNRTISYEHALMYDALTDLRPVPGYCDREFGFWSKPPLGDGA